jgi:hypothetical protein
MVTRNTILEQIRLVPVERLDDLYAIINSMCTSTKATNISGSSVLSYSGAFSAMSEEEFDGFMRQMKYVRTELFEREVNL